MLAMKIMLSGIFIILSDIFLTVFTLAEDRLGYSATLGGFIHDWAIVLWLIGILVTLTGLSLKTTSNTKKQTSSTEEAA
jgi:uncharacterized membrane protein